jgi:predicted transcriptional regulator
MEVHLTPELQAKIDQLVMESGRTPDELVEDALAGYVAEVAETRKMLDSRYDDVMSGRVKPITRDEVVAHFQKTSESGK